MKWPSNKDILEIKKYVKTKKDKDIQSLKVDGKRWIRTSWENKISYEVTWLGVPIIQLPSDIMLMQELIFQVQPDVIIECGVAHGGSIILYSSLLEILGKGRVIGIDIEIRPHNRKMIENHPMMKRITLIEGSSTSQEIIKKVEKEIEPGSKVLVCLDSSHARSHVLEELKLYSKLVTSGSYIVVFDTIMPELIGLPGSRESWDKDNPMEAIKEFLKLNDLFEIDETYNKLIVSYCPNGFLKKK